MSNLISGQSTKYIASFRWEDLSEAVRLRLESYGVNQKDWNKASEGRRLVVCNTVAQDSFNE